ncbi:helix-turn-helix domain-containing protein [Roseovarius sp. MS2]|uniref:helix-turn-helix domain-containing protein n=1 Tax=Roseovarius TaxID=74030 RepID=UPI003EDC8230
MTEGEVFTPVQIRPYVEALGEADAVEFLLEFGGAELYLGRNPRRSRVAKRFGREKAALLARTAEHLPARVPLARRWIAQVLYKQNLPISEIARKVRVSDVTVRAYLKGMGAAPTSQPDLFNWKTD